MPSGLWQECGLGCKDPHTNSGLIQKYVHLTREFEAPASYHVFSLLTAVAAVTRRRIVIDRKGYRLWPNLYVLLHGPSGLGKGIASGHAMDLVEASVGDDLIMYPEDLTGEGLVRLMYEQTVANHPCVGLVYSDEFSELLGGQDYKSEFAKRLTRLYASPEKVGVGRAKNGAMWVKRVFLSIIGCSQGDWLRTLPEHAIKGGLFARILVIPEEKVRHRRYEPAVDTNLGKQIGQELADRLDSIVDGVAQLSPAARALGEKWYMQRDAREAKLNPIVLPWAERQHDHAIKLGFLKSLLEGDPDPLVIDEQSLVWGQQVTEWLVPRIEQAFLAMNESGSGELRRRILALVDANKGTMREASLRSSLSHKYRSGVIDEALTGLVKELLIDRKPKPSINGGGLEMVIVRLKEGETPASSSPISPLTLR